MVAPCSSPGPRGRFLPALLVFPAFLLSSAILRADDPSPSTRRPQSWSFEIVAGPSLGGPSSDLEEAMRQYGFDDSISGGWFGGGTTTHPYTQDESWDINSYWGAARRRLGHGSWHVGLGGGTTEFPTVTGYREKVDNVYAMVFLEAGSRIVTLAPMAWYEAAPGLRLGAGPAIHRVDFELGHSYEPGAVQYRSWNPGFVVEVALTVPVDTPVYFAALAQYRFAGTATVGPWESTTHLGAHVEFPSTNVPVSHGFVGLGIGGRF
jgi:hypothetical protein